MGNVTSCFWAGADATGLKIKFSYANLHTFGNLSYIYPLHSTEALEKATVCRRITYLKDLKPNLMEQIVFLYSVYLTNQIVNHARKISTLTTFKQDFILARWIMA